MPDRAELDPKAVSATRQKLHGAIRVQRSYRVSNQPAFVPAEPQITKNAVNSHALRLAADASTQVKIMKRKSPSACHRFRRASGLQYRSSM